MTTLRTLLIDDSAISRRILRSCLPRHLEFEIAEADGGTKGLELHESFKPDLTFLDLTMADMNGIEYLKVIRARHPDTLVVVCTADVQVRSVTAARELGAIEVIAKPPTREAIAAAVARAVAELERRRAA